MNNFIVKKEANSYLIYDLDLGTFFALRENNVPLELSIGETLLVKNSNLWAFWDRNDIPLENRITGPIAVGFQVTDRCNLNCGYCIAKTQNNPRNFDLSNLEFLIATIKLLNPLSIWISGGEPTIYKDLNLVITTLRSELPNIGITLDTNGLTLSDELINVLMTNNILVRVSLDSDAEEIHNITRGSYRATFETIGRLVKSKINLGIMTVINNTNFNQLKHIPDFLLKNQIKRLTLLKLREGFSPSEFKLSDEKEIDHLISHLFKENQKLGIFTTFVSENEINSSIIINPEGDIITSNPFNGTRRKLGQIKTYPNLKDFPFDEFNILGHQSKYLKILNNRI